MKTIALFFCFAITFHVSNAQDPIIPTTHKDLVIKYTADWCPPCGTVGWAAMDSLLDGAKAGKLNAVVVAMHNSSYVTSLNVGGNIANLKSNLTSGVFSVPSFSVGRENLGYASAIDVETKVSMVTTSAAVANTGFFVNWALDDKSVTINTTTQFFSATTGLFSIGVYAYEDSVVSGQEGIGPSAVHKGILRAELGGKGMITAFGTSIIGASFYAGQKIKSSYTLPILATWNKKNIKFFAIVWKNNVGNWDVINVNDVYAAPTAIATIQNQQSNLDVFPNPAQESIHLPKVPGASAVHIYNSFGQTVYSQNELPEPSIKVGSLASGLYFVALFDKEMNRIGMAKFYKD